MSKPLEEVKKLTIGQLAALVHAIGGLVAVKAILRDKGLAKRVAEFISEAIKEAMNVKEKAISITDEDEPVVSENITLPTEMTIGGATYEILSLHKEGEDSLYGYTMFDRLKAIRGANLGFKDAKFLMDHQGEIPVAFREHFIFMFPGWYVQAMAPSKFIAYLSFHLSGRKYFEGESYKWDGGVGDLMCSYWGPKHVAIRRKLSAIQPIATLPTEISIGGRVYEILSFHNNGESNVKDDVMVRRSKEMNANLGEEDGKFIMDHQNDIPAELRGNVVFVFTAWRQGDQHPHHPNDTGYISYISWRGDHWDQRVNWRYDKWDSDSRVLRCKS